MGADAEIAKSWSAKQSLDGRGRYLIPGLWDMHVHFGGGPDLADENKALLPVYIANGITTVRDCAGDTAYDVLAWRDEIAAGRIDRGQANLRLDADFDPDTAMAAYRYMAAKGLMVTPTVNVSRIIAYLDRDDRSHDPELASYCSTAIRCKRSAPPRPSAPWSCAARWRTTALDRMLADTRTKVAAWNKAAQ